VTAVVAAFDFDGTLTRGGSIWRFLRVASGGRWTRATLATAPALLGAAIFGGTRADRAKEELFVGALCGTPADELDQQAERFGLEHYAARGRADTAARLEAHRRAGHRVVIVSASPELYIRPVARELGADATIATRLAVDDAGLVTGRYEGANCRGAEKVRRLRRWVDAELPGAHPFVWAYGNSRGDLDLLEHADVGVDVGRLGMWGALRHLPRLADAPEPIRGR
jgi:phosphatidylglycerophosphatase C